MPWRRNPAVVSRDEHRLAVVHRARSLALDRGDEPVRLELVELALVEAGFARDGRLVVEQLLAFFPDPDGLPDPDGGDGRLPGRGGLLVVEPGERQGERRRLPAPFRLRCRGLGGRAGNVGRRRAPIPFGPPVGRLDVVGGCAGPVLVEALLDDLQRQEVLALLPEDPAQARDVDAVELPVAGRGALGLDQPLALQEPDLRDRDVGELVLEVREHLADRPVALLPRGDVRAGRFAHGAPSASPPSTKVRTNRPTCSSARSCRALVSMRRWST